MRKTKLIHPSLQLRLTAKFVALAVSAMALQFLLVGFFLVRALRGLEGGGGDLAGEVPLVLVRVLVASLVVILPLLGWAGTLLTFRIAGPLYRFDRQLRALANGEACEPVALRAGDELGFLCDSLNAAAARLAPPAAETPAAASRAAA